MIILINNIYQMVSLRDLTGLINHTSDPKYTINSIHYKNTMRLHILRSRVLLCTASIGYSRKPAGRRRYFLCWLRCLSLAGYVWGAVYSYITDSSLSTQSCKAKCFVCGFYSACCINESSVRGSWEELRTACLKWLTVHTSTHLQWYSRCVNFF